MPNLLKQLLAHKLFIEHLKIRKKYVLTQPKNIHFDQLFLINLPNALDLPPLMEYIKRHSIELWKVSLTCSIKQRVQSPPIWLTEMSTTKSWTMHFTTLTCNYKFISQSTHANRHLVQKTIMNWSIMTYLSLHIKSCIQGNISNNKRTFGQFLFLSHVYRHMLSVTNL